MSHLVAVSVVMAALLVWGGSSRATSTPAGSGARGSIDLTPQLFEPGVVSTGAHDFVVRFTPRMDEVYVMRSGPDWYTGILRYRRRASGWGPPELAPVRAPGSLSYPFLAPDGSRIFFDVRLPARPGAGAPGSPDLWSAPRDGDGWGPAAPLGPEVNGPSVEMHASVAANGNLYFASNRPGGLGGFDIYRAVAVPGGFAAAENLGPAINSADNEYHAFIAPDERYLLFDARRSTGAGGNDIYISVRRADGGWEPAAPLGSELNTPAADMRPYVSPDGTRLFFCSDRSVGDPDALPSSAEAFERRIGGPGNGSQDIYWVSAEIVTRHLRARQQ